MADITARLPYPLSERVTTTASVIATRAGRGIDYAIAGIPFLAANSPNTPLVIETAEMNKAQTDQEPEPGEQSLQGWWIRSQDSWHDGAGALYQERREDAGALRVAISNQFYTSSGIDPWTQGELKLLKETIQTTATNAEALCLYYTSDGLYTGKGASVYRSASPGGSATLLGTATGETVTDLTVGKASWYAVTREGKVWTDTITSSSLKNFPLTNTDTTFYGDPRLAWAKHRLFAVYGRRVYVVDTSGASGTAQTAVYSHPSDDWTYTDIAEGPACVYLAGYSDTESCIQKVTIMDDGTTPTLTAGVTTAVLPAGERVSRIAVLAGTWVGIVTNRGMRVGSIDTNGDISYGPVFLQPDNIIEGSACATWDRFFYVSWRTGDGQAVVYRVDASNQPNNDGKFAWARDAEFSTTGYFTDLALMNDGRVIGALSTGAYPNEAPAKYCYQHGSNLVSQGTVTFGKIRYRTTEPKLYKYVSLDIEPLFGSITIDAILANGSLDRVNVYNVEGDSELMQSALPLDVGPQRSLALTFTLGRSATDSTKGPTLHSYSVKAIPAIKPQRIITVNLSCMDRERWVSGQEDGRDGWSRDRLDALQAIEDTGDLVLWQDFTTEDAIGHQVRIEKVRFIKTSPPNAIVTGGNYGGLLEVTMRTMD